VRAHLRDRRVRGALACLLALAGAWIYARELNQVYAIRLWLVWPLAGVWGWIGLFTAACASFGQFVLVRWMRLRDLPVLESAVLGMAVGVVAFVMAMYAAGALSLYTPAFGVALPMLLLAVGVRDGVALGRRALEQLRRPASRGPLALAIAGFGVCCVGLVYLEVLTPAAINYDASWHQLTVAQDYARAGRIVAFPADYNRNFPQLTALLHTWAYLVPGLTTPLRWMLALHNEFNLFLWTLVGVAAGVRVLSGEASLRGSWAAFFLFPIIFVYDSNLGGSADHICGFFSIPVLLASVRLCSQFSLGHAALLAVTVAGALSTKYQAVYFVVPAVLAVAAHYVLFLSEHRFTRLSPANGPRVDGRTLLLAPLLAIGLAGVLFSPHLIRNAVFHHNPVYPLLQGIFTASTPDLPNGELYFDYYASDANFRPTGDLAQRLWQGIQLFFTFSFRPHYSFTNGVPAFGSLFTLLLPALAVVRPRRPLLVGSFVASGAVLLWACIYHIDRNLQTFMPVLVCVTGALIVGVWRLGWIARAGLIPLVALQVVWGADAPFYGGRVLIAHSFELIASGFQGRAEQRFEGFRKAFLDIDRALPGDARVLLHDQHVSLGIDREIVLDWPGFQALVSYASIRTPRELYDYFQSLGITHLLYPAHPRVAAASKQEEVMWRAFVAGYAPPVGSFGEYRLAAMPETPPPHRPPYRVATLRIPGYLDGIYPVDRLGTMEFLPPELQSFSAPARPMPADPGEQAALVATADAVLLGASVVPPRGVAKVLDDRFLETFRFHDAFRLYLRRDRVRFPTRDAAAR